MIVQSDIMLRLMLVPEFTHGMAATVSVGQGSIEGLASTANLQSSPWGMETDFLDDSERPGAVLGPKTIPKRTHELCSALLQQGWEEDDVIGSDEFNSQRLAR